MLLTVTAYYSWVDIHSATMLKWQFYLLNEDRIEKKPRDIGDVNSDSGWGNNLIKMMASLHYASVNQPSIDQNG